MKILVTGGAGDIGKYVVDDLRLHDLQADILDIRPPAARDERGAFIQCDLMNLEAAVEAIRGYDAVIHLAAIPHPFNDPPERVLAVNMVTCYNVLEAVRLNGIPRIVYGCSESSSGFGIHNVTHTPLYLPLDESHPCWPHESYSFSKRFGEEMVENYARAYGVQGISLRYCWVWLQRNAESIRGIVREALEANGKQKEGFGCYIAPHDVAQGCRLAACCEMPAGREIPFEAFYLTADTTFLAAPTLEAMKNRFDPLPEVRDPDYFRANPLAPAFDTRKARRLLGFSPTKCWRTYDHWEDPA